MDTFGLYIIGKFLSTLLTTTFSFCFPPSPLMTLTNSMFTKVMQCKYSKQAWDKLKIIYDGESKVKESKLQMNKGQFESLKMKEVKNIGEYLLRVDEVVNAIRGLGGKLKEKKVVSKVLRTLPMRYDPKVSTLEE